MTRRSNPLISCVSNYKFSRMLFSTSSFFLHFSDSISSQLQTQLAVAEKQSRLCHGRRSPFLLWYFQVQFAGFQLLVFFCVLFNQSRLTASEVGKLSSVADQVLVIRNATKCLKLKWKFQLKMDFHGVFRRKREKVKLIHFFTVPVDFLNINLAINGKPLIESEWKCLSD